MSGGGWKDPLYKIVKQDSRNAAWLGNAIGWQGLEDEGKYNTKNPGHAVTKAAEYAIGSYLGGLYGGAEAAAGSEGAAGAFEGAAATGAGSAAEQAAQMQAMQQVANAAPNAGYWGNLADSGGVMSDASPEALQAAANNPAPVTDLSFNRVPVTERSTQAGLLDKGRLALSGGSSGAGNKGATMLAQQYGMGLLNQQPQPRPMMGGAPARQAPNEPLPMPYGTPAGNSTGFSEEQKRKLRAQGYRV